MAWRRLSDTAAEGWAAFARKHGITETAMREVIGRWLADHPDDLPAHVELCLKQLVADAEQVDAERRSRRKDE